MPSEGPLAPPELREIEASLDAGDTELAAAKLGVLADMAGHRPGVDFLTTRLLFQRGRIDSAGAVERLRHIVGACTDFPEALQWLDELSDPTEVQTSRSPGATAAQNGDEPTIPNPSSRPPPLPPSPSRPSAAPFDSLGAKHQLSASAGRYTSLPPEEAVMEEAAVSSCSVEEGASPRSRAECLQSLEGALRAARDGVKEAARSWLHSYQQLPPSENSAPLPPSALARVAQLHLLAGDPEEAVACARTALDSEPELPEGKLALAWALIRSAGDEDTEALLEARAALTSLASSQPIVEPGRADSLLALVEARVGAPAVALQLGQRALRADACSLEALAALAEASSQLGDRVRCEASLSELTRLSPELAAQVKGRLARRTESTATPSSTASRWHPVENALVNAQQPWALEALRELADDHITHREASLSRSPTQRGLDAGRFLGELAAFRLFGPYDFSARSIERLDVSLSMLFGDEPRALDESNGLTQLAAEYLGETLRRSLDTRWLDAAAAAADAALETPAAPLLPHALVTNRVRHGRRARLVASVEAILSLSPEVQLGASIPPPAAAVSEAPWPAVEEVSELGRALPHSLIGAYCRTYHDCPLDERPASLSGLSEYLSLVASSAMAPTKLTRWLGLLVGGYYGRVLCSHCGGVWRLEGASGAEDYVVDCGKQAVRPVHTALRAMQGLRSPHLLEELPNEV